MTLIQDNLRKVQKKMVSAAITSGHSPASVRLVAVSKGKLSTSIEEAISVGQVDFGENYVQEGINKIRILDRYSEVRWHFVGSVQSNKCRLVSENFAWCHTIDRLKIAELLSMYRPRLLSPLNILIQVNISNEGSKTGIDCAALSNLAKRVVELPCLRLRGIMAIPTPIQSHSYNENEYHKIAHMFLELKKIYPDIDTLSLGMSNDMRVAISYGSTMIRVGSAIFGNRK
jgi:hypothetical protein